MGVLGFQKTAEDVHKCILSNNFIFYVTIIRKHKKSTIVCTFLSLYKSKKVNTSINYVSSYSLLKKTNLNATDRNHCWYIRFIRRHSMFLNKKDEYDIMKSTWGNRAH